MTAVYIQVYIPTKIHLVILGLQPAPQNYQKNVARPQRLVPTIALIKYSFVFDHKYGDNDVNANHLCIYILIFF